MIKWARRASLKSLCFNRLRPEVAFATTTNSWNLRAADSLASGSGVPPACSNNAGWGEECDRPGPEPESMSAPPIMLIASAARILNIRVGWSMEAERCCLLEPSEASLPPCQESTSCIGRLQKVNRVNCKRYAADHRSHTPSRRSRPRNPGPPLHCKRSISSHAARILDGEACDPFSHGARPLLATGYFGYGRRPQPSITCRRNR